jgi:rRNA maturation endonuclease Nob1
MAVYWKWKCEGCGHEFVLTAVRLPDPCHHCGGLWFLKVGESEKKEERAW